VLAGKAQFTTQEQAGYDLFRSKACALPPPVVLVGFAPARLRVSRRLPSCPFWRPKMSAQDSARAQLADLITICARLPLTQR